MPRHELVLLPSLYLSLYRGEREEGAPLGFPLGGGGQGEGLRPGLGFPPQAPCPPSPRGAAALGGPSPLGAGGGA